MRKDYSSLIRSRDLRGKEILSSTL